MKYNFIETNVEGYIFSLTLAREAKRNAFTPTMVNEIAHALETANSLDEVKVVVLRAKGPVFCAGMDLKTYQNPELDTLNPEINNEQISLGEVFDRLTKPSIALVEGDVIAGGFLFILGCTYVLAKENLYFKLPEINLGIFPFQVLAGLIRVMPEKKALQLCLDGQPFPSAKALEYGIVDTILEENTLRDLLATFEGKNTYAIQAGMEALKAIRGMDSKEQYAYLLGCLTKLKDKEEVKTQMEARLKKD